MTNEIDTVPELINELKRIRNNVYQAMVDIRNIPVRNFPCPAEFNFYKVTRGIEKDTGIKNVVDELDNIRSYLIKFESI